VDLALETPLWLLVVAGALAVRIGGDLLGAW
jgi:hypothetical protein